VAMESGHSQLCELNRQRLGQRPVYHRFLGLLTPDAHYFMVRLGCYRGGVSLHPPKSRLSLPYKITARYDT